MELPNYFLADLPPEAELTPGIITEACQTLKRNRGKYLAGRSTASLVELLVQTGQEWLRPIYPLRAMALAQGPAALGFSRETIARGLDNLFQDFTTENFEALLDQDLGRGARLDGFVAGSAEQAQGRMSLAKGPELLAQVTAGNLPNPAIMSITLGLLARSAQFVKCASGAALLPRLFAHSLYQADRKLGSCLELAAWKGGSHPLESALLAECDMVTATGNDETLADLIRRLPPGRRFVGYGSKVSFAYIAAGMLSAGMAGKLAKLAAADICAWNQLGCLSPHVIYVQDGGTIPPEAFAKLLAGELEERELAEPRGPVPVEVSAAITTRRSIYELRASNSEDTRIWSSPEATTWTVVWEHDPRFHPSCLHRFVYVKTVRNLAEVMQSADVAQGKVSTVGLAAAPEDALAHALELARWGVARICPLGRMQRPPLTWRHDGRPALGDLLSWTDWEV